MSIVITKFAWISHDVNKSMELSKLMFHVNMEIFLVTLVSIVSSLGQYCKFLEEDHSNTCRIMSRRVEIALYVILSLVIICSAVIGVILWKRNNCNRAQNRPEGVVLRPAAVARDQVQREVVQAGGMERVFLRN